MWAALGSVALSEYQGGRERREGRPDKLIFNENQGGASLPRTIKIMRKLQKALINIMSVMISSLC